MAIGVAFADGSNRFPLSIRALSPKAAVCLKFMVKSLLTVIGFISKSLSVRGRTVSAMDALSPGLLGQKGWVQSVRMVSLKGLV
jgi:hypothetical protein